MISCGPDGGPGLTSASLGAQVSGIALGDGQVWAAAGKLVQIDPKTGAHRSFDAGPGAVSAAVDNGVWIAHPAGNLTRFTPKRGVTANITVGAPLAQVVTIKGGMAVWALGPEGVYEVSPETFEIIGQAQFRSRPVGITLANRAAYVATSDGHLVRISAPGIPAPPARR